MLTFKKQLENAAAVGDDRVSGLAYAQGALDGWCEMLQREVDTDRALGNEEQALGLEKALEMFQGEVVS